MPETKRFYYFTPTRYALEDIKEQRVKVAEMGKANDPYEMLPAMWNDPIERMALLGLQKYISGKYKIVCLSETYKDPSLWGHYADRCQGICLGFDIEVHKEERSRIITKMEYVRDRKDMSYFGISFVDGKPEIIGDKVATLMHYKSHHWEHEKEWRMWFTDDRLQLVVRQSLITG